MNEDKFTHLDLFSGIGGFALAAKRTFGESYVNVGHSEIDKDACKIYHKHIEDSECLGDIQKISLSRLGSLAKMPAWQESVKDLPEHEQDYSTSWQELLMRLNQLGLSSKMFPDFSLSTKDKIWHTSSKRFPASGIAWGGECLMLNTSEWHKDVNVCGLSEVLETSVPSKYYLSKKAVAGMIARSNKWGRGGYILLQEQAKDMTPQLKRLSLKRLESLLNLTVQQEEGEETLSQKLCLQKKETDSTKMKTLLLQQSEPPQEEILPSYGKTLILRRLTPKEKERLMGFPEGWTEDLPTDGRRGKGLGNAIVPQVAEVLLAAIKTIDDNLPESSTTSKDN